MVLHIKNMVCDRCIMVVRQQLDELGIGYRNIQLGQAELEKDLSPEKKEALRALLSGAGFELLDGRKSKLVEKIKTTIIELIHGNKEEELNRKISVLLEEKLGLDYHYISSLFSSVEGVTVERYVILQRIEKVKELLRYDESSLSEIAWQLGYSSVQHLSQQFKKVTGFTPSQFKQLKDNKRQPLDKV